MNEETRGGKYGRNFSILVNYVFQTIPEKEDYKKRFLKELSHYSFETREKGKPRNIGCVYELESLDAVDIKNPEDFARLVKEGIHLMYQKGTAKRVLDSLLENL